MAAGYALRARGWAITAAVLACAAGIALGNWQARRAEEKRALGERLEAAMKSPAVEIPATPIEARPYLWRRVAARGRFVAEHTVYLDNKMRRGRVGYEVVTPLRLAGSQLHLLVNRGWVQASPTREALPEAQTPREELRIEGIALERLPRVLVLEKTNSGKLRQTLDLDAYAGETGLRLQPIVLEQHSPLADGLARDWPRPDTGIGKHEAYALQWYALAVLAVVLALVFSFRKIEHPAK